MANRANPALTIPLTGLDEATVIARPNRFVAVCQLGEREVVAHVADSGRLKELLFPGNRVMVRKARSEETAGARKTAYDLVLAAAGQGDRDSVCKPAWVSVDTRYPNLIFGQALRAKALSEIEGYEDVSAEYWYHHLSPWREEAERERASRKSLRDNGGEPGEARPVRSRMDFFVSGAAPALIEVKSVTLCRDGVGYFPDAPTDRGARHLHELMRGVREGFRAFAVFIAQRDDITVVKPNRETDPAFADALKDAEDVGVRLLAYRCAVTQTEIRLNPSPIPVVVA